MCDANMKRRFQVLKAIVKKIDEIGDTVPTQSIARNQYTQAHQICCLDLGLDDVGPASWMINRLALERGSGGSCPTGRGDRSRDKD